MQNRRRPHRSHVENELAEVLLFEHDQRRFNRWLAEKVIIIMSQIDDVNTALDEISANVAATAAVAGEISADTDTLLKEIQDLEGQANPDLSGIIAKASALNSATTDLKTSLDTINAKVPPPLTGSDTTTGTGS